MVRWSIWFFLIIIFSSTIFIIQYYNAEAANQEAHFGPILPYSDRFTKNVKKKLSTKTDFAHFWFCTKILEPNYSKFGQTNRVSLPKIVRKSRTTCLLVLIEPAVCTTFSFMSCVFQAGLSLLILPFWPAFLNSLTRKPCQNLRNGEFHEKRKP